MEFEDFMNKIVAAVKERMGEGYRVSVQRVMKNNGITLNGLLIAPKESNMAPTVYLEPFYHVVAEGRATLGEAVSGILDLYGMCKADRSIDVSALAAYDSVKGKIRARLVNTGKNSELLTEVPHREYLDMSLIYAILFGCEDGNQGSIIIRNEHMRLWGVTEQELYEQAKSNAEAADDLEVISMSELLREVAGDDAAREAGLMDEDTAPMCIITNKSRLYGAVAMMDRRIMEEAAAIIGRDFMILPSSIHEVIAVPAPYGNDAARRMARMVEEVNAMEVTVDEVLSSHVYRYDYQTGEIAIAA